MKILVSACLLGENCKYNGGNNLSPETLSFIGNRQTLPVCPEMEAGMGCPRIPIEIRNGVLVDQNGKNVDAPMRAAIARILKRLENEEIACAVLKARSPTCGVHEIYDGTFTGTRVPGSGLFAQALQDAGYRVLEDEDLPTEKTDRR